MKALLCLVLFLVCAVQRKDGTSDNAHLELAGNFCQELLGRNQALGIPKATHSALALIQLLEFLSHLL